MQASSKRTGGVRGKRLHSILIGGQIALTLVLLAAAGAAIEGFLHLMHTNLGYEPQHTMSVGIPVHDNTYITWEARAQYFNQSAAQSRELPAVSRSPSRPMPLRRTAAGTTKFEVLGSRPRKISRPG